MAKETSKISIKDNSINREPIAIVGIGCRYPGGANTAEKFWEFLLDGKDGFCDIPEDRWDLERFNDNDPHIEGTARPKQAALLSDIDVKGFDAQFFGFSPREAECLDPQQRLLMQVAWEAFEDANIRPSDWAKRPVGVYVGGFTSDNLIMMCSSENYLKIDQSSASSSTLVMLSNRLSYFFDFKGPSLTIDTACSSSLVALNYACQDIWNGNTEAALVGGANAIFFPTLSISMSKGGYLSPDSRSKAFDRNANGYARGEGAGLIILKPLSQAISDGDRIYSQIVATGVNQDGRSAGIASPNGSAQRNLIKSVLANNHINPNDIVLIEAHGTGTAIGDPTEVSALSEALGPREDGQSRYISSVKGNIGHQEAGAGVAGIIKTALALYRDCVPQQASFKELNPALDLQSSHLNVAQKTEALCQQETAKLACVNSFGYGGTNAHAVLSANTTQYQSEVTRSSVEESLLLFSAKSPTAVKTEISAIINFLTENPQVHIADLAHTLACGREAHDFRLSTYATDRVSALTGLEQALEQLDQGNLNLERINSSSEKNIVFVYTGMGPQWWGMGHDLYKTNPIFREAVIEADTAFKSFSGWSILDEMLKEKSISRMAQNEIAQPANLILQHGLTVLLQHWGVRPTAIIGHSVGEVGAALAAGALTLIQAAEIAFHRSRLQQKKAGQGRMLATGLDLETARSIVEIYGEHISIGAINSPSSIALAGDETTLRIIMEELDSQGIFNKLIHGEVAYHSHQMDDLKEELYASLRHVKPSCPKVRLFSTAYGREIVSVEHDVDYWWANVRQPVLFDDALKDMAEAGFDNFIEIGPHPVLSSAVKQVFSKQSDVKPVTTFSSLSRNKPETEKLLNLVSDLWKNKQISDFSKILPGTKISIPSYPWQQERLWRESRSSLAFRTGKRVNPLLGRRTTELPFTWENVLNSETLQCFKDHIVDGKEIFPGAAYMEIFLAAVHDLHSGAGFGLCNVKFENLLHLPEKGSLEIRTVCHEDDLLIYAREIKNDDLWQLYARACIVRQTRTTATKHSRAYNTGKVDHYDNAGAYDKLHLMGLNYGMDFQPIQVADISEDHVEGRLKLKDGIWHDPRLMTHPALIDGGLQLLALCSSDTNSPPVPVKIGQVTVYQTFPMDDTAIIVAGEIKEDNTATLRFSTEEGSVVLLLERIEMKHIPRQPTHQKVDHFLHHFDWVEHMGMAESFSVSPLKYVNSDSTVSVEIKKHWPAKHSTHAAPLHVFISQSDLEPNVSEVTDFISFINAVERESSEDKIILITTGAWRIEPLDLPSPGQAALWGVARTTRQEKPKIKIVSVDLEQGFQNWETLVQLLGDLPDHGEYAVRDGQVFKHILKQQINNDDVPNLPVPNNDNFLSKLGTRERGGFAGLHYQGEVRRTPKPDEIEVEVAYSAINFKDILKVLSRLTDQTLKGTFFQKSLGMESSGTVVRVGENTDFRVGERIVFGCRFGSLQSHATFNPKDALVYRWGDLPLSLEELATIPIAYTSAFYGLNKIANLKKDETVLLHSATGGVGHAAINVARQVDATIIATAGTQEKRDYLRKLGIEHIFNSRNLDFEQNVLDVTQGKGVDVILNFLPEALLHANLRILKPFGRLIELGKADIGANKGLPLGEFERNLSFTAIDIDHMLSVRPDILYSTADDMKVYFKSEEYKPLPTIVTPANDAILAFKKMAEGNHIGKCLLDFTQPIPQLTFPALGRELIKQNVTYVITGGTNGFGLECAKWLQKQGAQHIVLLSRSARADEDIKELEGLLKKTDGSLTLCACDVGNMKETKDTFEKIVATLPPVAGIFHAAAVLRDGPMTVLTPDMIEESLHAKAIGGYNLHMISLALDLPLEHFVFFSSISAMVGNAGQASYGAANVYLDALADYRRHQGLAGSSIAWGPIGEVGMVARDAQVSRMLSHKGISPLSLTEAFDNFYNILSLGHCHTGCFNVDWNKWQKAHSTSHEFDPVFGLFKVAEDTKQGHTLIKRLLSVNSTDHESLLSQHLAETLAHVLHIDQNLVALDKPISELGVDSLMSIEFQLSLEAEMGNLNIPLQLDIQKTLKELAHSILSILNEHGALSEDGIDLSDMDEPINEINIDGLSDDEVERMLAELSSREDAH